MMFVNHTQTSQGFSGGLSVGVWEAKASGGDEPGVHVRVAGAFSHEDHHVAPKSASGVVLPVDVLQCVHNSDALSGSAKQIPLLHPLSAIWNRQESVVSVCVEKD